MGICDLLIFLTLLAYLSSLLDVTSAKCIVSLDYPKSDGSSSLTISWKTKCTSATEYTNTIITYGLVSSGKQNRKANRNNTSSNNNKNGSKKSNGNNKIQASVSTNMVRVSNRTRTFTLDDLETGAIYSVCIQVRNSDDNVSNLSCEIVSTTDDVFDVVSIAVLIVSLIVLLSLVLSYFVKISNDEQKRNIRRVNYTKAGKDPGRTPLLWREEDDAESGNGYGDVSGKRYRTHNSRSFRYNGDETRRLLTSSSTAAASSKDVVAQELQTIDLEGDDDDPDDGISGEN